MSSWEDPGLNELVPPVVKPDQRGQPVGTVQKGKKKGKGARSAGVRGVLSDDCYWLWPDVSGDRQLAQGLGLTRSYGTCVLACAETSWITGTGIGGSRRRRVAQRESAAFNWQRSEVRILPAPTNPHGPILRCKTTSCPGLRVGWSRRLYS